MVGKDCLSIAPTPAHSERLITLNHTEGRGRPMRVEKFAEQHIVLGCRGIIGERPGEKRICSRRGRADRCRGGDEPWLAVIEALPVLLRFISIAGLRFEYRQRTAQPFQKPTIAIEMVRKGARFLEIGIGLFGLGPASAAARPAQ